MKNENDAIRNQISDFNASIQVVVKIVANPRKIGKMIHSPYKRHTTNQEDYDFTKKLLRIWSSGHFFDIF